jgi:hypothetical protein
MDVDNITTDGKDKPTAVAIEIFKRKLKHLYKQIDTNSSLLWSHENHITGKRLRSENNDDDNKLSWLNKETAQTGYGEISKVILKINKGLNVKLNELISKCLSVNL